MKNQQKTPQAATSCENSYFMASVIFICIVILNTNHLYGQNQQRKWFHNSKEVDFTVNPPMVSTTANVVTETTAFQKATNGVHLPNNDRLININGTSLYSPSYPISPPPFSMSVFPNALYNYIGPEIAVFPKPGSCDSFYVFYGRKYYHNGQGCSSYELKYHLVDRRTLSDPNFNYGIVEYDNTVFTRNLTNHCPSTIPMAVSKEKTINGVKTRQLFYIEFDNVKYNLMRIDITYTSVSSPVLLYAHTDGLFYSTYELELSPDGTKLAFGQSGDNVGNNTDPLKDIYMYHLNATTGALNASLGTGGLTTINLPGGPTGGYPFERVIGLEFTPNSDRLFASRAEDKIYYISNFTSSPPTISNLGISSSVYTFSQMEELVSNGGIDYIAVAKNENEVFKINNLTPPNTPTINSFYSNAKVPQHHSYAISSGGSSAVNLLCLPDQVDGDNYTGSAGGWFDPQKSVSCCLAFYAGQFDKEAPFAVSTASSRAVLFNILYHYSI